MALGVEWDSDDFVTKIGIIMRVSFCSRPLLLGF